MHSLLKEHFRRQRRRYEILTVAITVSWNVLALLIIRNMFIYVPSLHDVGLRVLRLSKWHVHDGDLPPINFVSSLVSALKFVDWAM